MRRPDIIRPVPLHITLPEDVWLKLTMHLYSEVEKRVPKGAYRAFFIDRINEFFTPKETPNVES